MNNSFTLSNNRKKEVIEATSDRTGIFLQISKKDLWVTTILQIVFSMYFVSFRKSCNFAMLNLLRKNIFFATKNN